MEALGRNALDEVTEEDLEMIGYSRAQAETMENESNPDTFYQVRIIFGLHDLSITTDDSNAKIATLNQNYITATNGDEIIYTFRTHFTRILIRALFKFL